MEQSAMTFRIGFGVALLLFLAACGEGERTAFQREVEAYVAKDKASRGSTWETLDESPRTLDVAGRRSYEWAKRPPGILREAGLYFLHVLLERRDDADARADAVAVIARVQVDAKRVQEKLLDGTFENSGCDPETRRYLARALSTFQAPQVHEDVVLKALEEALGARDRVLCRRLLEVLSRRARHLPNDERDRVVDATMGIKGLVSFVGETYTYQRIALIGGPRATERVLGHLKSKGNEVARANRWAADVAGRLEWSVDLRAWLLQAMKGAPPAFSDDAVTRRQAVNACRDLVARFAKEQETNPLARKHLGSISRMLTDLEQEGIGFDQDEHLADAHARLRQELDEALGN